MIVNAKLLVREVGESTQWGATDFPSMRSAEAYAISRALDTIDSNPDVVYEIVEKDDAGNEQVVKTYSMQDVLPFIQEREQKISRPKDEYLWNYRSPRTPSGRPTMLPDDNKTQNYFPGDIVEVDPGEYESEWYRMKAEDAPVMSHDSTMNYAKADAYLQRGRDGNQRKIGNNTWLVRRGDGRIALKLHNTDIATFNADGTFEVSMDGWNTVTTKARINAITNARVFSDRGELSINGIPFHSHDEVKLAGDGTVLAIKKRQRYRNDEDTQNEVYDQWVPVQKKLDEEQTIKKQRGGEIAEIAYLDDKRSKKGWIGLVYAVIFLSDGEKGFVPQSMLAPVDVKGQSNEGDEMIMARKAQELKNDTFSQETESPSASQKDEGRTLEDIDRTQNVKNVIPGPWDGTQRHAQNQPRFKVGDRLQPRAPLDEPDTEPDQSFIVKEVRPDSNYEGGWIYLNDLDVSYEEPDLRLEDVDGEIILASKNPFYARAQTDYEAAETGHIGSTDNDLVVGDGKRSPGDISEPLYPSMHETNQTSTHKQL